MDSYNKDYPQQIPDFVSLGREIQPDELRLADKEFLIALVLELKKMELKYYKAYHKVSVPYESCNCY